MAEELEQGKNTNTNRHTAFFMFMKFCFSHHKNMISRYLKKTKDEIRTQAYLQTRAQVLLKFPVFEELELVLHPYQRGKENQR